MNTGVSNVWSGFSDISLIDAPIAWLLNKKNNFLIFFERCKRPEMNNIKVYSHLFYANHLGEPYQLKNTRLHSLECARETWNELIAGGWTVVKKKFQ
tara:strand:+ start:551 stop:841 length:291 start_codon:yes stop_codon:yes gene_type:complete